MIAEIKTFLWRWTAGWQSVKQRRRYGQERPEISPTSTVECSHPCPLQDAVDTDGRNRSPSDGDKTSEVIDEERPRSDAIRDLEHGHRARRLAELVRTSTAGKLSRGLKALHESKHLECKNHPQDWSNKKKWLVTCVTGATGFLTSGASAFASEFIPQVTKEFHIDKQVALLATSLYMVSFGLLCIFSGPLSEVVGRNRVYVVSLLFFSLAALGSACSSKTESWLIFRSLMGAVGAPSLVTFGGTMRDMWSPHQRIFIFPILACLNFTGPFIAPAIGDLIVTSPPEELTWHGIEWTTFIFAVIILILIYCCVPETYEPVLTRQQHAQCSRRCIRVDLNRDTPPLGPRMLASAGASSRILVSEWIVSAFGLYLIVIYGILFGFLPGFNIIFGSRRDFIYGLGQKDTGLCFLALVVGFLLALLPLAYVSPRYHRLRRKHAARNEDVPPEEHLIYCFFGSFLLPISIFWLAYTAQRRISLWCPILAVTVFGFSYMCIYISVFQYVLASYGSLAGSALIGMVAVRYLIGGGMVHSSLYMYEKLGVRTTLVVMGSIASAMSLIPLIFWFVGSWIRARSRRAVNG